MYWVVGAVVVLVVMVLVAIGAWRYSTVRPNGVPCSLRALPQDQMDHLAATARADAQAALEREAAVASGDCAAGAAAGVAAGAAAASAGTGAAVGEAAGTGASVAGAATAAGAVAEMDADGGSQNTASEAAVEKVAQASAQAETTATHTTSGAVMSVDSRAVAMATKKYLADHPLPVDAARWHHGVLILGENEAGFYRLRSFRPKADVIIPRSRTEIVCRRQGSSQEVEYCEAQTVVLLHHEDGSWVELAIDARFDTALVAWLESAPSDRTVRMAQLSGAATLPSLVGQEKARQSS